MHVREMGNIVEKCLEFIAKKQQENQESLKYLEGARDGVLFLQTNLLEALKQEAIEETLDEQGDKSVESAETQEGELGSGDLDSEAVQSPA